MMANFGGILDKVLTGSTGSNVASALAGGVAGSLLTSKKGRKLGKSALKVGGVAAVGALAYSAYKKYQDGKNEPKDISTHPASTSQPNKLFADGPALDNQINANDLETILVTAMIAASRADGQMDVKENQQIFKQIRSYQLPSDKEAELISLIENPVDMDALIKSASTPEIAAEIYAISVVTMDEINASERDYLTMLAMRLKLTNEFTQAIENEINNDAVTIAA
jgi:uncharacterized membrane protein YebE (DUF533 family)